MKKYPLNKLKNLSRNKGTMTKLQADILIEGKWWGTAYGESATDLDKNTSCLLIKLMSQEEIHELKQRE